MRVLLLPSGNALSHLAKALAVREALQARGHEGILAVSEARSPFLESLGIPHHRLPDLQEADHGPAPSFAWFREPERFLRVVAAERALMAALRPDRVLGVFRFTTTTAAALEGIPCDTLACGCMLPGCPDVLGFSPGDPGREDQRAFLDTFYGHAAARVSVALDRLGRPPVGDLRDLLLGRHTSLWDTPAFQPLPAAPNVTHVGPLAFEGWPAEAGDLAALDRLRDPLAVLSMGTALSPEAAPGRILQALLDRGFHVALAGGGQPPRAAAHPRVTAFRFAPMGRLLERAALLVCQGGQQTVFEAMAQGVPVAVQPFHPEQAQNGLCLERLDAGRRLVPATVFWGSSQVYHEALNTLGDRELGDRLERLAARRTTPPPGLPFEAAGRIAERMEA